MEISKKYAYSAWQVSTYIICKYVEHSHMFGLDLENKFSENPENNVYLYRQAGLQLLLLLLIVSFLDLL